MTERLYPADSFLREFDATVTEIQELSHRDGRSLWRLALDRSAFYPTGGGQPHDIGHLVATARSGAELTAEIIGVEEDEQGEVWHHTAKPLAPGTSVRGVVDWTRRLDHMRQHSGQHLLSATFFQVCGAPTVSFHLGETVSTIDLATEKLPAETLLRVESLANGIIADDVPFTVAIVPHAQAEAWLASGDLRKLPPRAGDFRIVQIGVGNDCAPFDRNACGGTHVGSSGQIGGLHLRGMEKVREGWRVEFVCGLRAVRAARGDFQALTEAARNLSVGLEEVPEAVARMQTEGKQSAKKIEAQGLELAQFRAAELVRQTPVENGLRVVRLVLSPPGADSPAEAKLLASRLTAQAKSTVAIFAWQAVEGTAPATVIFARSADVALDCGAVLRQALAENNGRGGGSKEMAQGSVAREQVASVMDALAAQANSAR